MASTSDPKPIDPVPIFAEIAQEIVRSVEKHGDQRHRPLGTGPNVPIFNGWEAEYTAATMRLRCQFRQAKGTVSWLDILLEEVAEAAACADPREARAELVQVATVAVKAIEAIDSKGA